MYQQPNAFFSSLPLSSVRNYWAGLAEASADAADREEDANYYLARARAEIRMAEAATHPRAREIHLELAAAYLARA